jgi:hypothetical protein
MQNERSPWVFAVCLLVFAWAVGCLNPRPEDFPSAQPPGEMSNPGGSDNGAAGGPPADPDPVAPATGEPPHEEPGNTPGGGGSVAADAGAPPADAAAPDAAPAADAN